MRNDTKTLDQILRERARKQLQADVSKAVRNGLDNSLRNGTFREIRLVHSQLKVIDNGAQADERYIVKIPLAYMAEILIEDGVANMAASVEQAAVDEFVERIDSLGAEIDELRSAVQE